MCSTPTDAFAPTCQPAPLALPFLRIVPGPEGTWALSGEAGFVELR